MPPSQAQRRDGRADGAHGEEQDDAVFNVSFPGDNKAMDEYGSVSQYSSSHC